MGIVLGVECILMCMESELCCGWLQYNVVRPTENGGEAGNTTPEPPNFCIEKKWPHEAFLFLPFWADSSRCFIFLLHCLSEAMLGLYGMLECKLCFEIL